MTDQRFDRLRWSRVKQLVADAIACPAAERAAFVAAACAGDDALRGEVEALLAAHDQAGDVFDRLPPLLAPSDDGDSHADAAGLRLAAGHRLLHYEIREPIGAGGMGEVYRAHDTRLHRDVALKILPAAFTTDRSRRDRLVTEARAASAVEHPHIAVIHEIGEADGITFIAMELVRGEPLGRLIARGALAPQRALALATEVAEALARSHEIGLVHRDLKPSNVMVTEDDHVKIIDFGVAKPVRALGPAAGAPPNAASTATGVVGTPSYMSPEQAQALTVDHRSDIFSFGIMLHEMLTGRTPFRGETPIDTMHAILHAAAPPLPASIGPAAADLQRIIERCLSKNPGHRYQGARDLLADLRSARRAFEAGAPPRHYHVRIAVVAVAAALAIALLIVAMDVRRTQDERDRADAIANVKTLVDRGQFVDVWRTTAAALARWPGDPALDQMRRSASDTVTITTEPPGAEVFFKAYDDVAGEWLPLGRSPLRGVRAPLGMLRWKIVKEGFDPLEARLEVGAPAAAAGRPDDEAGAIRLRRAGGDFVGMVFVPGGPVGDVQLTDFWMDQHEVTNRDFKTFVDQGGYLQPAYWTELPAGAQGALRLQDQTGRTGPSTWELGTYPRGRDEYPVSGVSWFEAAAYCRSAGKNLPTIFHWKKAFGATFFMEVVTLGNFGGEGLDSVERLKDLGPYGTRGMAGNVKEWTWNEHEGSRYILGGAWNEPPYMATNDDVRPPADRAETNGFRCITESDRSAPAAYAPSKPVVPRDFTKEKPVDPDTFEVFRRFYSYDQRPLEARIEHSAEFEDWRRERVSFTAAYGGERVMANILLPKNAAPPYQSVIWFPGSYALRLKHSDRDLPFSYYFDFIPRSGRALVYPVYKGTYERSLPFTGRNDVRDVIIQWSKDLHRTVDYLKSRGDFDGNKLAYYGFSMGAGEALPALAMESRLKAAVLLAGGLFESGLPPEVDQLNFVPRITMPVLLLAGRYDFSFPVETSQTPLFTLLGTPLEHKRHVIFENAGHVPPRLDVIRETLAWLDRYLGPVR